MTSVGIMASAVVPDAAQPGIGSATATTSGTTLVITTVAPVAVNDLIVVRVAADNLNASTPTFTCTDSAGHTYTTHTQRAQNATAAAGVAGALIAARATSGLAVGSTITVTLSGAVAHRAAYAEKFTGFANTMRGTAQSNSAISGTVSISSGVATAGDLAVGAAAIESRTAPTAYDTDTASGSWSAGVVVPSAGTGTDDTCVEVVGQSKVTTGSVAQTFNLNFASTDYVAMIALFRPG